MAYKPTAQDLAPYSGNGGYVPSAQDLAAYSPAQTLLGKVGETVGGAIEGATDPVRDLANLIIGGAKRLDPSLPMYQRPPVHLLSPGREASPEAQIGRFGGSIVGAAPFTEAGAAVGAATKIPELASRLAAMTGLGAVTDPQDRLKGAALGLGLGGLGEGVAGIAKGMARNVRPFVSRAAEMRQIALKYPGSLRSPQEVAHLAKQTFGLPVGLGQLVGDQALGKLTSNKEIALALKSARQEQADDIMDALRGGERQVDAPKAVAHEIIQTHENLMAPIKNKYELATKYADAYSDHSMLNQKYVSTGIGPSGLPEVALKTVPGKFINKAKQLLKENETGLNPSFANNIKSYIKDPSQYDTFEKAHSLQSKIAKDGSSYGASGDTFSRGAAYGLSDALKEDILDNMPPLSAYLYQEAREDFKKNIVPFRELGVTNKLLNSSKTTGDYGSIANGLLKNSPESQNVRNLLPQDTLNKAIAHHFKSAVSGATGHAMPAQLSRMLQNTITKEAGVPIPKNILTKGERLNAINQVSPDVISSLFTPRTGAESTKAVNAMRAMMTAKSIAKLPESLLGKLGVVGSAIHSIPSALLNLPGVSDLISSRLSSPAVIGAYVHGAQHTPNILERALKGTAKITRPLAAGTTANLGANR